MADLRCFFEKVDLLPLGINGILQISFQNISKLQSELQAFDFVLLKF